MSLKTIQITIPSDKPIPDILNTFIPEENYLMIKIGCETLSEGRKVAVKLSNDEVYKKIENDFRKEIENLDNEIKIEKGTSLKMQEKITKMYETQIEQLNKKLENAILKITNYENESSIHLNEEIDKVKKKYDMLLEEKDKQNQLNREVFDKAEKLISKNINKTSITIGDDGEQIFETLSDTFRDFPGYKIENKAKQGHKGDFHLFFKDFNILVDSKNYSGSVQKKEITKIESDLMINDNMRFAWMVSLNSNISDYNRFPIMTKWITTEVGVKCILFINNLLEHKDPRNILRQALMMCDEFFKLTKKINKEDSKLEKYLERDLILKKQIEILQERTLEIRRSINSSNNILKHMDNDLLEILSLLSDKMVNDKFELNNKIKEWFNMNIDFVNDENKITSTEMWNKFKKDNKEFIGENKMTIEIFKDIITGIVNTSTYVEKSKKGAVEFIGFRWKETDMKSNYIKPIENLVIENICIDSEKPEKKTKLKKTKKDNISSEPYFDYVKDNKILNEYNDISNDIMKLSLENDVRPWQIVSLLMRYKVIDKRDEARGYNIYKETEEYKQKFFK
jgi:hypothetical protein